MTLPEWQRLDGEAIRWKYAKQHARAIDCQIKALEILRELPAQVEEVGTSLNYLAFLYLQDGQLAQAESTLREALEWRLRLPAEQRHLAAEDYMMLADVLSKQGRHEEALEAGQHGLALHQSREPKNGYDRKVKEVVKQLKRNLADAQKRERKARLAPSRTL
jgi:tetratricopeptide (TPR) repeat protein